MKALITGGTGFIGKVLCQKLLQKNYQVVVLTQTPSKVAPPIKAITQLGQLKPSDSFDVVINLAGEPIADKRWSNKQKQRMLESRVGITEQLIDYLERCEKTPSVLISGSAVGYYGVTASDATVDETGSTDQSFSSMLCQRWEATARKSELLGIRTCLVRTGIVLGKGGGVMQKLLPVYKLGLGGKVGSGKHWMPWIHIEDMAELIIYCINHTQLSGPINATAPTPVTNKAFSKSLAKVLKRPAWLAIPSWVITLLMGQMGQELLLSGKNVVPVKALQEGFEFRYGQLEPALESVVARH